MVLAYNYVQHLITRDTHMSYTYGILAYIHVAITFIWQRVLEDNYTKYRDFFNVIWYVESKENRIEDEKRLKVINFKSHYKKSVWKVHSKIILFFSLFSTYLELVINYSFSTEPCNIRLYHLTDVMSYHLSHSSKNCLYWCF